MQIRTILTCLLSEASAELLSEASAALADRHDAHLIGQHTHEAIVVYPGVAMHMGAEAYASFNKVQQTQSDAIEKIFRKVTDRMGIEAEWRGIDAGSVLASDRMIESARTVDLVVMTRPAPEYDRPDQRFALDQVIRNGGRPVLMVPHGAGTAPAGKCALIAHAGTRESARAAFDVLPLLERGAEVHIVHVGDEQDALRDGAMTELSSSLSRHGFEVTMSHRSRHGKSISETLLAAASEVGADVIASGAYGHSRSYAFFIGATTGELVRGSPIPVLFSA